MRRCLVAAMAAGLTLLALNLLPNDSGAEIRFDLPQQEIGTQNDWISMLLAVDLDRDGDLDLVTGSGFYASTTGTHPVLAWRNDGTPFPGSWTPSVIAGSEYLTVHVATGDLDSDGWPDLVLTQDDVACANGQPDGHSRLAVLHNDGTPFDGSWSMSLVSEYTGALPYCASAEVGDLDGDGRPDIAAVVDGSGLWIFQNDGSPFADPWPSLAIQTWTGRWARGALTIVDLDLDSDPDLAFSPREYQLAVLGNDGTPFDGGWTYCQVGSPGYGGVSDIVASDLDRDGYPDLVTTVGYQPAAQQYIWRNDGTPFDGGWPSSGLGYTSMLTAAAGDLDLDGDPDIASGSNPQEDFELIAWENDGTPFDGSLPPHDLCATGSDGIGDDLVADLDGDGDLDVVFLVDSWSSISCRIAIVRNLAADPRIASVLDVPNDQGGSVVVRWGACRLDGDPSWGIESYWLWRRLGATGAAALREQGALELDGSPVRDDGRAVLRRTLENGAEVYWEFLAEIPARGVSGYAYTVATHSDSMTGSLAYEVFVVDAKSTGAALYSSAPDSGYSVDNLPPLPPAAFIGNHEVGEATISLYWEASEEPDFARYRLYADDGVGFFLLSEQGGCGYVDNDPAPGRAYRLTAMDVHGNESQPAVTGVTGVDPMRYPLSLGLPAPNPAAGPVTIGFTLPAPQAVTMRVLDVQGRVVRTLSSGALPAGAHSLMWDGRDDSGRRLPSGLFLLRLETGGARLVRRVMLVS